jgi:AmmeMemoRadiSam system protein B/AmmeMemoRadiSam system protein A
MTIHRSPAVAGTFYPADPATLAATLDTLLAEAPPAPGPAPKAIIAPHAGYMFSGPTAAAVYVRLRPARGVVRRVVLIGPAHRVPFHGLALSGADVLDTPLGPLAVDKGVGPLPHVTALDEAHAQEHSLEVHLPFLKAVLGDVSVVPLLAGQCTADQVAAVLNALWGGPETLIVVSSDLSHFLDYDACKRVDAGTVAAIEHLDPAPITYDHACGRLPIAGLLTVAKRRGLRVETVDVRNSGDTAGPRDRVVGYGAWAFYEPTPEPGARLVRDHGTALLRLAGESITHGLEHGRPLPVALNDWPEAVRAFGAAFVTLTINELRGCIGSAMPWRPLVEDVAENAFKAAFGDPRFAPLRPDERADLTISLTVLDPPQPMIVRNEADLLARLRPGVDGLILEDAGRRGLFLPSVWEALPDPVEFVAHLRRKAGLPPGHWSPTIQISRFAGHSVSSRDAFVV